MLKEILSISGKPGLFKLVSHGKNMLIVESLTDKKRVPAYAKDKVVSLGDIAIYTETDEKHLSEVMELVATKENRQKSTIDPKADNETLKKYLEEILPDYDKDRVYPSDIKKLIGWYNLLIEAGINDFSVKESDEKSSDETTTTTKDSSLKKELPKQNKSQAKTQTKSAQNRTVTNRKMGG